MNFLALIRNTAGSDWIVKLFGILLIPLIALISNLNTFCQLTDILIVNYQNNPDLDWSVSNESGLIIIPGNEFEGNDSIFFQLESDRRFFLEVFIPETIDTGTMILSLEMSGLPLIAISSQQEPGDISIPFFTGYHPGFLKIVGGTDADIADFPWQVFFTAGNYMCGGSIIADNWIVTAAHCTKDDEQVDIPASAMLIKAGATNRNSSTEGKVYEIDEVFVHESYDNSKNTNDIALLKLKTHIDVEKAGPVSLISAEDVAMGAADPGVVATVTGWGMTDLENNLFPSVLQQVQLPIVSNQTASLVWGNIPSTILMAGYQDSTRDACYGDSGGPLVVTTFNGMKLAGIVCWGSDSCDTYGGYTRVSKYLEWVELHSGVSVSFKPEEPVGDALVCAGTESSVFHTEEVPGAVKYEWITNPEEAGTATGDNESGEIFWNPGFSGPAYILVRVIFEYDTSHWAAYRVEVLDETTITRNSGDTTVCENAPLNLYTRATGNDLKYQWYYNNLPIRDGNQYILRIREVKPTDSGIYRCEVTGLCGTVASGNIEVNVIELTRILSASNDMQVPYLEQANIEVQASGNDLKYYWKKNDQILSGENMPVLTLNNVKASDIGLYQSIVEGSCGNALSDPVYLFVIPPVPSHTAKAYVWPSLTSDYIHVALQSGDRYDISLINGAGRLVYSKTGCRYQTQIFVGGLASGVYFIRMNYGMHEEVLKFVVR